MKPLRLLVCALLVANAFGCAGGSKVEDSAVRLVDAAIAPGNQFGITAVSLETRPNPKGEGVLVYSTRSTESRAFVWVVIDGIVAPANSPSKMVTPQAPWPREVNPDTWSRTGLQTGSAAETIRLAIEGR